MMITKMTRIPFEKNISREDLNELPLKQYTGSIQVIDDTSKLHQALGKLQRHNTVGFDTETKPSFSKGEYHPVAMVQLATVDEVFLIRLSNIGLTQNLAEFLANDAIKKIGVSIRDDLIALQELRSFLPAGFVELHDVVKQLGIESEGLRKLTATFLGFRISKSQQTSNWEKQELKPGQITYAATDAWCCLEIYKKLERQGYLDWISE